ncbi:hypothetical protein M430DRAFT_44695 [Amorphotheca resinae ATCC 22711]|uniref:Uncharacterized protein n=1 Tax=Amorphotheca resinae ATCC 22711 TaxID=857342 RepID=A0A2T3ASS6_AMORE|nr:hypothetical protein M430DRAFT_44695 [Amorphotheca resinae ATCC 22711]PSS10535.1 hypothetical protein M430DRAFT_44695 [Amorphotheca resinae ATCC 22711]
MAKRLRRVFEFRAIDKVVTGSSTEDRVTELEKQIQELQKMVEQQQERIEALEQWPGDVALVEGMETQDDNNTPV